MWSRVPDVALGGTEAARPWPAVAPARLRTGLGVSIVTTLLMLVGLELALRMQGIYASLRYASLSSGPLIPA